MSFSIGVASTLLALPPLLLDHLLPPDSQLPPNILTTNEETKQHPRVAGFLSWWSREDASGSKTTLKTSAVVRDNEQTPLQSSGVDVERVRAREANGERIESTRVQHGTEERSKLVQCQEDPKGTRRTELGPTYELLGWTER